MQSTAPLAALVLIASLGAASAGGSRDGAELQVNTYTTGQPRTPVVASGDHGRFVVVWEEGYDLKTRGRRYDPEGLPGPEFLVQHSTASYAVQPAIASLGSNGFVAAWLSIPDLMGRLLHPAGVPVGQDFQVNAYPGYFQIRPAVAGSKDGSFVVVWQELNHDGFGNGVFARLFDSLGRAVGGDFQVNTWTAYDQKSPSVAWSPSGEFVVVWVSDAQDGSDGGIFGQIFEADGTPSGSEFQVNTYTTGSQDNPQVGIDRHGDFLVVWSGVSPLIAFSDEIHAQRMRVSGDFVGSEFLVNTYSTGHQQFPAIAMSPFGETVVTWVSYGQDGSGFGIFGQRYDRHDQPRGSEFQINTYTTGQQLFPAVAIDDDGEFFAAWEARDPNFNERDVAAQRFHGPGPDLTSHMDGDMVDCSDPVLSRPTFSWGTDGYEQFKIFMGHSSGFEKGTYVTSGDKWQSVTSWMPSKKKWRKACRKALEADPVTPQMHVVILGKDQDLSKSDPTFKSLGKAVELDVTP